MKEQKKTVIDKSDNKKYIVASLEHGRLSVAYSRFYGPFDSDVEAQDWIDLEYEKDSGTHHIKIELIRG